jgi:hypothetical protein
MGIEDDFHSCFSVRWKLEQLAENYWSEPIILSNHKRTRQCVAALKKLQKIWRQLAPMHRSIAEAGFLRRNPHLDRDDFATLVADSDPPSLFDYLNPMLEACIQDIEFLIRHNRDYRKRLTTKVSLSHASI